MKKLLSLLLVFFAYIGMSLAQSGAEIYFEKDEHDFGTIEYMGDGTYEFVFTNTGDEPLIISSCKGSCGCTVPVWPKEPILPGTSNVIKVKYDTKRAGRPFSKSVTVSSNAKTATKVIRIKGRVADKPEEVSSPVRKNSAFSPAANPN
jgi:hypothetical protein